jgi:RNA polymerase sigma-70 factor (ECF subfamily)
MSFLNKRYWKNNKESIIKKDSCNKSKKSYTYILKGGGGMEFEDLEKVYVENAKIVYKYLLSLSQSKDISEELTQETFFQASKSIANFRGECKVSVWLCQIAKYLWYGHIKRNQNNLLPIENFNDIASDENVESNYGKLEEKRALYRAVDLLEPRIREVVNLRLGEFSFKEIGEIVGESENWCRVSYHRSKLKIMKLMKG